MHEHFEVARANASQVFVSCLLLHQVKETSDGRTFSTRTVEARQNGTIMYTMQASFQPPEVSDFEHSKPMPDAPAPETLPSADERVQELLNDSRAQGDDERSQAVRSIVKAFIELKYPIEVKYATYQPDYLDEDPEPMEPRRLIWMRTRLPLGDDPNMHRVAATFFSDHALLATALLPHRIQFPGLSMEKLKILASLGRCHGSSFMPRDEAGVQHQRHAYPVHFFPSSQITACGFTARFARTNGCCTRWNRHGRRAGGLFLWATSTQETAHSQ